MKKYEFITQYVHSYGTKYSENCLTYLRENVHRDIFAAWFTPQTMATFEWRFYTARPQCHKLETYFYSDNASRFKMPLLLIKKLIGQ